MSITVTLHGASAPLDHRLGRGDGQAMLMAAPSALYSPQSPSYTQIHSRTLAKIPSANGSAELIHTATILAATHRPNSNSHSLSSLHHRQFLPRGFLPRGLSDAYRRTR